MLSPRDGPLKAADMPTTTSSAHTDWVARATTGRTKRSPRRNIGFMMASSCCVVTSGQMFATREAAVKTRDDSRSEPGMAQQPEELALRPEDDADMLRHDVADPCAKACKDHVGRARDAPGEIIAA